MTQKEMDDKIIATAIRLIKKNNDERTIFKGWFDNGTSSAMLTFQESNDNVTYTYCVGDKMFNGMFEKRLIQNVL